MLTIRIVGNVAALGADLETARQAALQSLKAEGITTIGAVTAARNKFVAGQHWIRKNPGESVAPCAWTRAHAAAAEALAATPDDIDLILSLRNG